jgi:hypothetical protein
VCSSDLVQEVDVDLLLPQQAERFPILHGLDVSYHLLEHHDARVNTLQVPTRHLKDGLGTSDAN